MSEYDAVVVGSGPNGLAAAVELARSDRRVLVVEQAQRVGGGTRTEELTMPGYRHDLCSAIHPLGIASPFFAEIRLEVDWVQPGIPLSHPVRPGHAVPLLRDVAETAGHLGQDGPRYRRLMEPLVEAADQIVEGFVAPLAPFPSHLPSFLRFAALGALPASTIAARLPGERGKALFAGLAAHAIAPFDSLLTSGVALLLGLVAHSHGWPLPRGGSQSIADALVSKLEGLGGEMRTGIRVNALDDLPPAQLTFLDLVPRQVAAIGGDRLSPRKRRGMARRPLGPGVFKLDLALDGPVPWLDEWSPRSGTVHVGGTWEEVAEAEETVHRGGHPERPFVLVAQQSLFDPSRAPRGKHTLWAYTHVPNGSTVDMTERIEAQIERFAPGFRDLITARHVMTPTRIEARNPNNVGGDIGGGRYDLRRVLQLGRVAPYRLGPGLFICSSAVPPGAGVHGMCGYYAARAALGQPA